MKITEQNLDQNYWNHQWQHAKTGWDIGYSSPPIEEYMLQYANKNAKILIPGCGNAHEAEFLLKNGFNNITVLDIAQNAVEILQKKFQNIPEIQVICEDFFLHHGKYDLIIEQTFFCAIPTTRRSEYVKKTHELLEENGKTIGVLFNRIFEKQGPPFGGSIEEYHFIFKKYFEIIKLEDCYNSIKPRAGSEVFINFKKK